MNGKVSLPPGYRLIVLRETASTNQAALDRIAADEAIDGDIVWTERQTAGRGRQGREWQSHAGNLFMTIIAEVTVPLNIAAQLSFVAAIAALDAIDSVKNGNAAPAVTCKWPNDILIDGKKSAGILLEVGHRSSDSRPMIAVGVGVNLAQPPSQAHYPATCLGDELGVAVTPLAMLQAISHAFERYRKIWLAQGFGPIRQRWLDAAHRLGDDITVRTGGHQRTGTFGGLDETGALLLGTPEGNLAISAGDVHFPDTDTTP